MFGIIHAYCKYFHLRYLLKVYSLCSLNRLLRVIPIAIVRLHSLLVLVFKQMALFALQAYRDMTKCLWKQSAEEDAGMR